MKAKRKIYIYIFQLVILILFFTLTLLNEEFDLPHHLFGDPPVSIDHRHAEMLMESFFFCMVVAIYFFLGQYLLKKIEYYEQRKEILERTFYHDIHNTALTLHGFARRLDNSDQDKVDAYKKVMYQTSRQLLEEIEAQRDIAQAEKDELSVHMQELHSLALLSEVFDVYTNNSISRDKKIVIGPEADDVLIVSDKTLIKRVLGNMVKNALEASRSNETVTLGCKAGEDEVEFFVHNPGYIPRDIQKRIFEYSFSTKGKGRGLGTYSMKLLCERYLHGNIVFQTSRELGTTFKAFFPVRNDS